MLVITHRIPRVFRHLWVGIFDRSTLFVDICYSVLAGSSLVLDFITWTLGSYTLPIRILDYVAIFTCHFDTFINFVGFPCSLASSFCGSYDLSAGTTAPALRYRVRFHDFSGLVPDLLIPQLKQEQYTSVANI